MPGLRRWRFSVQHTTATLTRRPLFDQVHRGPVPHREEGLAVVEVVAQPPPGLGLRRSELSLCDDVDVRRLADGRVARLLWLPRLVTFEKPEVFQVLWSTGRALVRDQSGPPDDGRGDAAVGNRWVRIPGLRKGDTRDFREDVDPSRRHAHLEHDPGVCKIVDTEIVQRSAKGDQRCIDPRCVLWRGIDKNVEITSGSGLGMVRDGERPHHEKPGFSRAQLAQYVAEVRVHRCLGQRKSKHPSLAATFLRTFRRGTTWPRSPGRRSPPTDPLERRAHSCWPESLTQFTTSRLTRHLCLGSHHNLFVTLLADQLGRWRFSVQRTTATLTTRPLLTKCTVAPSRTGKKASQSLR